MKDIRFGIIGCGDVTEKKSGPAFKKVKGSDLTMVMRRNEEKLIDYAKRHHIEKYTTNASELLADDQVDAIYIATPPKWHCHYVLEAAKYKKPIYVEKPMALTLEECQQMVEICKKENVPLFVAYYRRGQEKFKYIKEVCESGKIGEIRGFHYVYTCPVPEVIPHRNWLLNKEEAGEGLLFDIGSHMVDILLFLFGDVKKVYGGSYNQSKVYDVSDITSGVLSFESGVQGSLQFTFNAGINEDRLIILGSEGSIEASIMSNDKVIVKENGQMIEKEFEALEHVQQPFIQEVVDRLHDKNKLDSTGIAGLKTQEILEKLK